MTTLARFPVERQAANPCSCSVYANSPHRLCPIHGVPVVVLLRPTGLYSFFLDPADFDPITPPMKP